MILKEYISPIKFNLISAVFLSTATVIVIIV